MKRNLYRLLLVLFCLCLLLAGCGGNNAEPPEETPLPPVSVSPTSEPDVIAEKQGVTLLESQSQAGDSYYKIQAAIQTVSNGRFKAEVKQLLTEQWAEYLALDESDRYAYSQSPGYYHTEFGRWDQAEAWLGVSPANPLEDADWLEWGSSIGMPLYGNANSHCEVSVYGDKDGGLQYAYMRGGYRGDGVRISLIVTMYTARHEAAKDNIIETSSLWAEANPIALSFETYTMSDGQEALVVISGPNMNGYLGVNAYFVRDGMLYNLHAAGDSPSATAEQLYQVIARMLDEF